jgi:hypothetical protein
MKQSKRRAGAPPLPWYQRPNVRNAFGYMAVTIVAGYVISRTAVISDAEKKEVEKQLPPSDHTNSVLYKAIRESEERLAASKK